MVEDPLELRPHRERSCSMPSPRNTSVSAARAINAAVSLVEPQEERMREIRESKKATLDEKFEASSISHAWHELCCTRLEQSRFQTECLLGVICIERREVI